MIFDMHRKGRSNVTTEAKIGTMPPQAKVWYHRLTQPSEVGGGKDKSLLEQLKEAWTS